MIDKAKYKNIYSIPLPTSPNMSFTTNLEGDSFDIEFRVVGDSVLLIIKLGDQVLVNNNPIKWLFPMNLLSKYKYPRGDFWFEGEGKETYENLQKGGFYFGSL